MWGARVTGATVDQGAPYLQTIALYLKVQIQRTQYGICTQLYFKPPDRRLNMNKKKMKITTLTTMPIDNQIHPIWAVPASL